MAGYSLKFVQRDRCRDKSDHEFTDIYTFFSPQTKLKYVLRAEYFCTNTYAIKFYAKRDRSHPNKYSRIVDRGDTKNILLTAGNVIERSLDYISDVSFALAGSRSFDPVSNRIESYKRNQRFRIYRELLVRHIGDSTFEHIAYDEISCYLLLNKQNDDLAEKRNEIEESFRNTYDELLNVQLE